MVQTSEHVETNGRRHSPRTPPGALRAVPEPPQPPPRIGLANRLRWRRASAAAPMTARRVVGLARFGVETGLDPDLARLDAVVRGWGLRRAQPAVDAAARVNRWRARRCDALAARSARLAEAAAVVEPVVVDPVTGAVAFPRLVEHHEANAETVGDSVGAGARRHRRVARGHRRMARVLPWLDALLFGYFVSGVSNADLTAPWTTPVASLVAVGLTLLVVAAVAAFTPWLGRHLRHHKAADGELDWTGLGPIATGLVLLWTALLAAMGVTMFVRVQAEAAYAGTSWSTALVVSLLLALAVVAMNVYVLLVAFSDGTAQTDDLVARGRVLIRHGRRRVRLLRRASAAVRRRRRIVRRAAAAESAALALAGRRLLRAERLLDLARLRTGVLRPPDPAAPAADRLDLAALEASRQDV